MGAVFAPIFLKNIKYFISPSITSYKNKLCAITIHAQHGNYFIFRFFETNNFLLSQQKFIRDKTKIIKKDGTVVKLKTEEISKIFLINESEEISVTLEEAKKIAKHKGLNLIKVNSLQNKCLREVYELVSDAEFLKYRNKISSESKIKKTKEKIFKFTSKISDNDIKIKVKNILRSFKSCDSIRCYIKFDDGQVTDTVFEKITKELGSSYTVQKIPSPINMMQFVIYNSKKGNEN